MKKQEIEKELDNLVKKGLLINTKKGYLEPRWCNSLTQEQRKGIIEISNKSFNQGSLSKEKDVLKIIDLVIPEGIIQLELERSKLGRNPNSSNFKLIKEELKRRIKSK